MTDAADLQGTAEQLIALLYNQGQLNVENVNSGAAVTLSSPDDFSTTVLTLNHATPAITLPTPGAVGQRKRLYLVQDGTGSRVPTWAAETGTLTWLGATAAAPVLQTAAAAIDVVDYESLDGVNWTLQAKQTTPAGIGGLNSLVSGTAKQDTSGVKSTLYVEVIGGSSGTAKIEIGPTNGVANNLTSTTVAVPTGTNELFTIALPASWWVKVTLVTATFGTITQVLG